MILLRIGDVEAKTALDRVTIWRLERVGLFPRRRLVAGRTVRWIDSEIEEWIASLPAAKPPEIATAM